MNSFTCVLFLFSCSMVTEILSRFSSEEYDTMYPIMYNITPHTLVTAVLGRPTMMYCYSKGNPRPKMTWYYSKDDPYQTTLPIDISEKDVDRIVLRNHSQELIFHKTKLKDTGYYTCYASNELGDVAFMHKLTVLLSIG